jgi:hypothetical protein
VPPANGEDSMDPCAQDTEDEDAHRDPQQAAHLTTAELNLDSGHRRLLLLLIDQVVNAQREVGTVELTGERRELPYAGDGAPRRTV